MNTIGVPEASHKRLFLLFYIAQFLYSLARNLINPFFPAYVASFGVSYAVVGAVMASFGVIRVFVEIPGGILIDRLGRRPVILLGFGVSMGSHLLGGIAQSAVELAFVRMIIGVGSAFTMAAGMLLVGELVVADHRHRSIARFQSASSIGGIIGPTVGGVLVDGWGIRTCFIVATCLTFISFFLVYQLRMEKTQSTNVLRPSLSQVRDAMTQRSVLILCGAAFIMFFTFASIRGTMIPLYGTQVLALTSTEIGVIYSLTSLIVVMGLILVVPWVERTLGHARLLVLSLATCAAAVAVITGTSDFASLAFAMIPLGIGFSLLQPTPFAMLIDYAIPEHRGLLMGVLRTMGDLGLIIGPLLVGGILDLGQPLLVFYVVASIIGLFAMIAWRIGLLRDISAS